jgi:hypothetical protein
MNRLNSNMIPDADVAATAIFADTVAIAVATVVVAVTGAAVTGAAVATTGAAVAAAVAAGAPRRWRFGRLAADTVAAD